VVVEDEVEEYVFGGEEDVNHRLDHGKEGKLIDTRSDSDPSPFVSKSRSSFGIYFYFLLMIFTKGKTGIDLQILTHS
jgi:hypothetical protein